MLVSLATPLIATACSGSEEAYADAVVNRDKIVVAHDISGQLVIFTIPVDYTSNNKKHVKGIIRPFSFAKNS